MIDCFEDFNWHDNTIHGFRVEEGADGCSGQLTLDIDYILEWLPPTGGADAYGFVVAPADLIFHEVTDLVVSIDYVSCSAALQPMMIHEIRREDLTYPNGYTSFAWTIEIGWPDNSFISFQSPRMSQVLRGEPIRSAKQCLGPSQRP
jgi:hypothetical protein